MYSSLEEALMINWLIVPLKDTLTPKMKKKNCYHHLKLGKD